MTLTPLFQKSSDDLADSCLTQFRKAEDGVIVIVEDWKLCRMLRVFDVQPYSVPARLYKRT